MKFTSSVNFFQPDITDPQPQNVVQELRDKIKYNPDVPMMDAPPAGSGPQKVKIQLKFGGKKKEKEKQAAVRTNSKPKLN